MTLKQITELKTTQSVRSTDALKLTTLKDGLEHSQLSNEVTIYKAGCFDFLKSLDPGSVDIIITDPAYSGMNNKMQFGNGRIVGKYQDTNNTKWFPEFTDDADTFREFLRECYRVLKDDRHIYIMIDSFS